MGVGRDLLYAAGAAVSSPVWGASLLRTGKWRTDWAGRFGKVAAEGTAGREGDRAKHLLLHAVSVGEANALRQLVAWFEQHAPAVRLTVASTTNTGFARATELFAERHSVVRYPLDFSFAVARFLDVLRPDAVALVELEVWPNFVEACDRRAIPVCVINGRLGERSFGRYRMIGSVLRPTFAKLAAVGAQTSDYAQRFEALGVAADRVRVLDTMKWDTASLADGVEGAEELAEAMGVDRSRRLVVAGSTGPGEEAMLLRARGSWGEEVQLMLVPRKPERFEEVAALQPGIVRRTQPPARRPVPGPPSVSPSHAPKGEGGAGTAQLAGEGDGAGTARLADVFLLDTLGELRAAYALADVVVVGRSFDGLGGSDPIEPIALGRPTIIGPDYHNFAEVVEAFEEAGGLAVVNDEVELNDTVRELLRDRQRADAMAEAGRAVIRSRLGATRRHGEMLLEVLEVSLAER